MLSGLGGSDSIGYLAVLSVVIGANSHRERYLEELPIVP